MKRLRAKLTYANVIATIALFIALGGASYAATQLPKNSVGTKQLKSNAVTAAKIKKGAVTGSKINLSTLGAVPSATNASHALTADTAGNAQTLGGKTAEQIAAQSGPKCPAGTKLEGGLCFETSARPAASLTGAIFACATAGRWLPTISQLLAYEGNNYEVSPPFEWTESISQDGSGIVSEGYVAKSSSEGATLAPTLASASNAFRCVVGPAS